MVGQVIIIEGTDCVGKTSVVRRLQDLIPKHNLVKLSAAPDPHMTTLYMSGMYEAVIQLAEASPYNHLILDRYTTSERVYGYLYRSKDLKDYQHLTEYETRLKNVHHVLLVAWPTQLEIRLSEKKLSHPNEQHPTLEELVEIQNMYLTVLERSSGFSLRHQVVIDTTNMSAQQTAEEVIRRCLGN